MFGGDKHKDHKFLRLAEVYEKHCDVIQKGRSEFFMIHPGWFSADNVSPTYLTFVIQLIILILVLRINLVNKLGAFGSVLGVNQVRTVFGGAQPAQRSYIWIGKPLVCTAS